MRGRSSEAAHVAETSLKEDQQPSASPLSVCLDLTHAIIRTTRLEEIYEAALDALAAGLHVPRASILLFDPDGVMRFKAWRGLSAAYRQAVEGHSPWRRGTTRAEPIVVPDVTEDGGLTPYLAILRAEHISAAAFIPLEGSDGVMGKFMLYYRHPYHLPPEELHLAGIIAAQVAFAVERTRVQLAAEASEERLRFALEAANMGTWDWDVRDKSVRWSDNVERIHGLPPGTFDGSFKSYERDIHSEDRERVLTSIERALSDHVPHDVEYRVVGPDGRIRWVEGKGRVEYDAAGRPARMSGVCMNVTQRKDAERARMEALEESSRASERLAAIVESSDDAIVGKSLEGVITSWNRGAERMFGYPASEAIGQPITLIIPTALRAEEELVLSSIRAGKPVELETVRRRKDGSSVDISLKVSPVKDTQGRIVGASKIARDITARKRGEAERAELQRRLTMLVTASASLLEPLETESVRSATLSLARQLLVADAYAVWATGPDAPAWHIVRSEGVSPAFSSRVIARHENARSTAMPFTDSLPVSDVTREPMLRGQLAAYEEEGIRSMLISPMRLGPDSAGTLVFYYRTLHSFTETDVQTAQALANLAAAALTTADLHEQQRMQHEAAESARRQAAFLADATTILSRSLDYEQTLGEVARLAVPEIADWCAVDIVDGSGVLQRLTVAHTGPPDTGQARESQQVSSIRPRPGWVDDVVRSGKPAVMASVPDDAGDLAEFPVVSYVCVPLISTSGTFGAITFAFTESGRHYTERDLAFAKDVATRATLAIEHALAYRRVHEANRMKDEFLATLSHELRTPLNAILGYAQMLNEDALDPARQSRAIAVLMRNAEALKQIIHDVLDVSRIASGKLQLKMRPVRLDEVLHDAVATMQPTADAKGVSLRTRIDESSPLVSGDPDRLQQVVWNLLSNAVKFTPRGGHVELCLEHVDAAVRIVVTDDGQGIDPAFLPHTFERFRQADSCFSREHSGLGLGLAIVRELIELHGGTVSAWSNGPGTGATFTVQLPPLAVEGSPINEAAVRLAETVPAAHRPPRLRGVHILAVDDEGDSLGLLQTILELAGAEVTAVDSGERALELLEHASTFDALITDIGMPRMDGLELIRRVRQTLPPPINRLPAAALTAYARSQDSATVLNSGFQMHVSKPVNPSELVVAVAALLGR